MLCLEVHAIADADTYLDTSYRSISSPTYGMTVIRLVITVRAQKDMRPHGSTYPKKAVPIIKSHTPRDGWQYDSCLVLIGAGGHSIREGSNR